jgi:hypothetical protein
MMSSENSDAARERHVDAYIEELRRSMASDLNEQAIQALAALYRSGWRDAEAMFRMWEGRQ